MSEVNASFYAAKALKACFVGLPVDIREDLAREGEEADYTEAYKEKFSNCLKIFGESHDIVRQAMVDYLHDQPIKGGLSTDEF